MICYNLTLHITPHEPSVSSGRGPLGYKSACVGTTSEQALENQAIRTEIASHPDIVKLFHTYKREDGSTVELEKNVAWNHVRHCLGEIKKTAKKRGLKVRN